MVRGITYILVNNATTASLIGESAGANEDGQTTKVYPVIATQKENFPLVTVWETARVPQRCRGKRADSFQYQYEIHVYANDYDEINSICQAVEVVLYEANVDSLVNGVRFQSKIEAVNRRDVGYIDDYKAYAKVVTFEAMVYEGQTT